MKLTAKQKQTVGFSLIIIILIVIIYLNRNKPVVTNITDKLKKVPATDTTKTATNINSGFNVKEATPVYDDSFPLKDKSKGERVKTLQLALNRLNDKLANKYAPLVIDGSFGPKTYTAIVTWAGTKYWGANGLTESNFNEIIKISNATTPATPSITAGATPSYTWTL